MATAPLGTLPASLQVLPVCVCSSLANIWPFKTINRKISLSTDHPRNRKTRALLSKANLTHMMLEAGPNCYLLAFSRVATS